MLWRCRLHCMCLHFCAARSKKNNSQPWQWGGGEHGTMTMDLPHLLQRRNEKLHSKLYFFFLHNIYVFFVPSFGCPIQNATHFTVEVGSRRYSLLCELVVLAQFLLAEMSCIVIICIITSILSRQLFDAEGFNKILSFRLSTIPNYCSNHDIFGEWFQPSNLIISSRGSWGNCGIVQLCWRRSLSLLSPSSWCVSTLLTSCVPWRPGNPAEEVDWLGGRCNDNFTRSNYHNHYTTAL